MKTLQVKKKKILIPDSWEDLSFREKLFTFRILIRVLRGDLKDTPHVGLLKLLVKFTGYKPASHRFRKLCSCLAYGWESFWIYILNVPFWITYGWKEYREYTRLLKAVHRPDPEAREREQEIIDLGLLRLAGQINFVYRIDPEEKKIHPLYTFKTNPFPWVRIGKNIFTGKRFILGITAATDITARCFVDALDMLIVMDKVTNREDRDECVNKICAILYPAIPDHNENMLSGHDRLMRQLDPVIKFGIVYWFTGIVQLFREHEVYRILFDRTETGSSESGNKISVGMNEIALFLKKEGYGDPTDMNLIDYFDAQVKSLKDYISKAIADGVKPGQIAQKTGIPQTTINKLS